MKNAIVLMAIFGVTTAVANAQKFDTTTKKFTPGEASEIAAANRHRTELEKQQIKTAQHPAAAPVANKNETKRKKSYRAKSSTRH